MLKDEDKPEAVRRFCAAVQNIGQELIENGGVSHTALASGLRIEASKIEMGAPRAPMKADDRELVDLVRKGHEYINALVVAGVEERTAIVAFGNALIERVARTNGAAGAAEWLRRLAALVDQSSSEIEATARAH